VLERPGHGISRGGRLDQIVWNEFASDIPALQQMAEAIRHGYRSADTAPERVAAEDDEESEFPEGRIVYRLHRARERNQLVVRKKKARV
jgi:5-methylcytosine-specific restriction protein A